MEDITIAGQTYRIGKINVWKQFHVARKLAPLLFSLGTVATKLTEGEDPATVSDSSALFAFGPVAEALSKMSDADTEFILNTCLDACMRQQPGGWAKLRAANGVLLFEDIDLQTMMQLTIAVIKENLGNFFPAQPGAGP